MHRLYKLPRPNKSRTRIINAAVRMAARRSTKAGNIYAGHMSLYKFRLRWNAGMYNEATDLFQYWAERSGLPFMIPEQHNTTEIRS